MRAYLRGERVVSDKPDTVEYDVTFVDDEGVEIPAADAADGSNVVLTGYEAGAADDLAEEDTVNEAFAKLEARVVALETP